MLNDWHIGAIRTGGTTPATAYQLRQDLLQRFEETLYGIDTDLLLNGDLFDTANIPMPDLLRTYQVLTDWLTRTGKRLLGSEGNHDLSKNSTQMSSFQFLIALLCDTHPEQVIHISGGQAFERFYVLSHVANQDIFDMELTKVPECDYLFVHCNYDNGFAAESDHSLNMSREQVEKCLAKQIVFAHEHQARTELGGRVVVVGNQVPSSVSDCLNNSSKSLLRINDSGLMEFEETWKAEGDFSEQDWRDLKDEGRFVRVTGKASAAEADQVVNAIARFRQKADVLVITNAVKIEGTDDAAELALSHEAITQFNVLDALMEMLEPAEQVKVKKLLEIEHA
jgi:hypothetical protein